MGSRLGEVVREGQYYGLGRKQCCPQAGGGGERAGEGAVTGASSTSSTTLLVMTSPRQICRLEYTGSEGQFSPGAAAGTEANSETFQVSEWDPQDRTLSQE